VTQPLVTVRTASDPDAADSKSQVATAASLVDVAMASVVAGATHMAIAPTTPMVAVATIATVTTLVAVATTPPLASSWRRLVRCSRVTSWRRKAQRRGQGLAMTMIAATTTRAAI
jgi:hypothetical protein